MVWNWSVAIYVNTHVVDRLKHELVNFAVDRSISIFALVCHSLHISGSETEGRRKTKKFEEKDEVFVCMCLSFGSPILQRLDIILVTNIEFLLSYLLLAVVKALGRWTCSGRNRIPKVCGKESAENYDGWLPNRYMKDRQSMVRSSSSS